MIEKMHGEMLRSADLQRGTAVPLVSVVIPTHDRARLLRRALISALAQTHLRIDVVVVDDVSTDDTPRIVEEFQDSRIRYIRHETNRGGAAARNTGIRAANGKYIAFLDDDDEWEADKTRVQLGLMDRYAATLCGYRGEQRGLARRYQWRPTVDLRELKRGFFRGGGTSALMARADILKELLFDEELPRCQDWDLCIRLAKRWQIGYVAQPLVRYNDGDHARISNRIRDLPPAVLERELRMVEKHKDFFGRRLYRRHMCRFLLGYLRDRPNRGEFLRYAWRKYGAAVVIATLAARLRVKLMEKLASLRETALATGAP
jgi:glycosyltransferase involved in cell wall biosynthesis